ncbi:MAG: cytochrome b/b6 domain-containing protein [Vitreoscilla sp.]
MSSPELLSDFGAVDPEADVDRSVCASAGVRRVVLWDLPLRVFHWSLVAAVSVAIVTGELGGAWMPWHGRAGLVIVGLLVFRVLWGVVGSATSRFAQFAPTPARLLAYLRGRWRGVGHDPLGALAVFALLGLLSLQSATGLFGNDDIAFAGPLNHLVDDATGARATGWHRWLANGLVALVALHLLAIAFHVIVKRHRLVRPMISGRHELEPGRDWPRSRGGGRFGLLSAVAVAATAVLALAGAGERPVSGASLPAKPALVAAPAGAASTPAW